MVDVSVKENFCHLDDLSKFVQASLHSFRFFCFGSAKNQIDDWIEVFNLHDWFDWKNGVGCHDAFEELQMESAVGRFVFVEFTENSPANKGTNNRGTRLDVFWNSEGQNIRWSWAADKFCHETTDDRCRQLVIFKRLGKDETHRINKQWSQQRQSFHLADRVVRKKCDFVD